MGVRWFDGRVSGLRRFAAADQGFEGAEIGVGFIAFGAADEDGADELKGRAKKQRESFPAATRISPQRFGRCGGGFWIVWMADRHGREYAAGLRAGDKSGIILHQRRSASS